MILAITIFWTLSDVVGVIALTLLLLGVAILAMIAAVQSLIAKTKHFLAKRRAGPVNPSRWPTGIPDTRRNRLSRHRAS